ncbi:MAG: RNA 3'-terminal phosphate cyclase [Candidatus Micrarchaeota archaeon]|nr:RNA 3'-terminal phosphate cyclase [Candidatus Micrarchaeota archaeon]
MDSITIDGSKGEGGGQILRTALALSCITKIPFTINEIRAKRPKPGLQAQHVTCANALSSISQAEISGNKIGSKELYFNPKKIIGGYYEFDIGTAGSISLLIQAILPVLLNADRPCKTTIIGGTHVSHSPSIDYFENVFLPIIRKMGANAEIAVERLGWYPKGNGKVTLFTKQSKLNQINITEKIDLKSINGIISQSNLPEEIMEREEERIRKTFPGILITKQNKQSDSPGNALTLWAEYDNTVLGCSLLGEKGLKAEDLADSAALQLNKLINGNGAVDPWMGDQLLIYMALAKGESRIKVSRITSHMKTCMEIIPLFTKKEFKINDKLISVEGIGN